MKIIKNKTNASQVLRDIEHTNLATFSLNEVELVNIDGEDFFAKACIGNNPLTYIYDALYGFEVI